MRARADEPALDYGALAPPLEPTLPEEDFSELSGEAFSLEAFSEDSPAEVPPAAPLSEEPEPFSEELSPLDSPPPVVEDPSPVVVGAVEVVAVVEVEVVSVASFSAEVSFGG